MGKNSKEFLTVKDLADRYSLNKCTIYSLLRAGKLPAGLKIGRSIRWKLATIEVFEAGLQEGRQDS